MEFRDLCVYMDDTLIFSDIHMGYEEALNKQGILIPRHQYPLTIERIKKIVGKHKRIIINGDIKHEFGQISETEWRHTLRIIDFLSTKCDELILIKGNHDTILGPIAEKRNVKVMEEFKLNDTLIIHGDSIQESAKSDDVKRIIIGHEHPAVSLMDYPRVEKFKCFLKGDWKGKELVVMPSFNLVQEGTDILRERLLSPFLKNIEDFEVHIVGDEVLYFGKIKKLRKLNG
ncbi:MAG: metallophosphoesterase [Candidatus Nanoarchaeia archaeon]